MVVTGRGENDLRVPTPDGVREPQNRPVESVEGSPPDVDAVARGKNKGADGAVIRFPGSSSAPRLPRPPRKLGDGSFRDFGLRCGSTALTRFGSASGGRLRCRRGPFRA